MSIKGYYIYTFGCAMNEYDSERIAAALEKKGFIAISDPSNADIIIFNTCSVREKPQVKILSYLGIVKGYKVSKPNLIVGISGCVAQQEGKNFLKKSKVVNFVMGTESLGRIDNILNRALSGERFVDTESGGDTFSIDEFERKESVSAYVTVMKGCENFCSYCIVPYVRGKELSRTPQEIITEVERLVDLGIKEVILLGQNVNSYGKNLSDNIDFSDLLTMVNKIDNLKRIRFITSHPKDFSKKMVNTIAELDKVCKYIHLPIQSGSDNILSKMNRGYTYKEYMNKIDYARKIMPSVCFSSDFIVGFPGEEEDDFLKTLKAIEYVEYDQIFAFNYSPRPMTDAEKLEDNVPLEVKSSRLSRLFQLKDKIADKKLPKNIGEEINVLVTGISKVDKSLYTGFNEINKSVNFISKENIIPGDIVSVKITESKRNSLIGYEVK